MPCQQVVNAEAVGGGSDAVPEHHQPADAGALVVGVHLGQLHPEAHREVLVTEVAQAGPSLRGVAHGVDREHRRFRLPVVDGHPLDLVEHGGSQVVDGNDVAHQVAFNGRGTRRRRPGCCPS